MQLAIVVHRSGPTDSLKSSTRILKAEHVVFSTSPILRQLTTGRDQFYRSSGLVGVPSHHPPCYLQVDSYTAHVSRDWLVSSEHCRVEIFVMANAGIALPSNDCAQ